MNKIQVYMMPGLAASPAIFELIALPDAEFETHLLEWEIPLPEEGLAAYAKRMSLKVLHDGAVLVGVSFGGILVQEMAQYLSDPKVIIISSVRCNQEFPRRMKVAKATGLYHLIPVSMFLNLESLAKYSFGKKVNERLKLYEKFLAVRDKGYLKWAVEQILLWDRSYPDDRVLHIHGDEDQVFPLKYIKNATIVKGGTHLLILLKHKWLNQHLPALIKKHINTIDQLKVDQIK